MCNLDWEKTLFCFVYRLSIAVRLAGDEVVKFVSPLSVEGFKFLAATEVRCCVSM